MLKDYYKIFGVKEDASDQEIRARWIELMRHYHPDVQKGMEFDEISKEINEAYQILKDPFLRADYDHNLAQHRYYGGKRVSHRLGLIFLGSILFIAIIYMVMTSNKTFIPSVSQPIRRIVTQPQIEKEVPGTGAKAQIEVKVQKNQINPSNSINSINQKTVKVETDQPDQRNPNNPSNPTDPSNSINQPKVEAEVEVQKNPIDPINPSNPTNRVKVEAKAEVKKNETNLTNQTNKTDQIDQSKVKAEVKAQKNSINPADAINPTSQQKAKVKVEKTPINPSSSRNPINPINQPKTKGAVKEHPSNSINPSNPRNPTNPLVAKDEEVKKFFANYIGRYNQKDLIGFMFFFSNRAIQNQKDRLESIKRVYTIFFNQSLELKYRLSDLKIEIYQNVVNVSAQYELDQLTKNGRRNAFRGSIQWVLTREEGGLKIVSLDYQQAKGESHEI